MECCNVQWGFVNHEAAQGPRDQTSHQSESSDGRERCAGSDAMIVEVPGSIIREEAVKSKIGEVIQNLRAAERRCRRAHGVGMLVDKVVDWFSFQAS